MQTPSHVVISLFFWRNSCGWRETLAVTAGAILPDISMFFFYGYQKLIGSGEKEIWGTLYYLDDWQLFFDCFNSIPIFLVLALVCLWRKQRFLCLLFASALVHVLCDLPVHNDDAHRHFLPLTNWRFISPVSYWDPQHYGLIAASSEFICCLAACGYLSFGKFVTSIRIAGRINLALYVIAGLLTAGLVVYFQLGT